MTHPLSMIRRRSAALLVPAGFLGLTAAAPDQTPAHIPPMAVSNEANAEQLALARREGAAFDALVQWEAEGAAWSEATNAGDYRLVAALSPAEGFWSNASGAPRWSDPPAGTVHLRLFVQDAASLRFVPGLIVHVRMLDANGGVLAEVPLVPALYPVTEAYGANVTLPPGTTRIATVIEPLQSMRHDPYNGDRFYRRTTALFDTPSGRSATGPTTSERAETSPPQALLARRKAALDATLKNMWNQASDGGSKPAGDMTIGYAIEYSEGFWQFADDGEYRYSIENDSSELTNAHIEVVPIDPRTGNFLSGATINTVVRRPDANYRRAYDPPFLWHSWLYHYGSNVRIPSTGDYQFDVRVTPPAVPHYGRTTGDTLFQPEAVSFQDVHFETGSR